MLGIMRLSESATEVSKSMLLSGLGGLRCGDDGLEIAVCECFVKDLSRDIPSFGNDHLGD